MKAHQKKPYDKYRDDTITIGDMLDLYTDAKAFMINLVSEKHGKNVQLWPRDIQKEMTATFTAGDMFMDIMIALHTRKPLTDELTSERYVIRETQKGEQTNEAE